MQPSTVLAVLAGTDLPIAAIEAWAQQAAWILAADGAANRLLSSGIEPSLIIGDMDSVDPQILDSDIERMQDDDAERTDCDKLVEYLSRQHAAASLAVAGLEGDRFDHVLSSIHSFAKSVLDPCFILRDGLGWFVRPGKLRVNETRIGQRISLIPLLPSGGVRMSGVRWIPQADLSPVGATSVSNEASASVIEVTLETGLALLVLQADPAIPAWP